MLGWVTYFNFIPSSSFYDWFTKFLIQWNVAIFLANIIGNFLRISKYFPSTLDSWRQRLLERSFWWWIFSRTLGVDTIANAIALLLFVITRLCFIWPFRYFFVYSQHCHSDALHRFLVNIVTHTTGLLLWSLITNMAAYGTIKPLSRFYLRFSSDTEILIGSVFCGYQLVFSIGRYIWLFMSGGCTWWGSLCVSPIFLVIEFIVSFLTAPVVIASTYKRDYFNGLSGVLQSEQFKSKLLKEHQDETVAERVFVDILDMTTRLYVFSEKPAENHESDQQIFERMFNLACLKHAAEVVGSSSGDSNAEDGVSHEDPPSAPTDEDVSGYKED